MTREAASGGPSRRVPTAVAILLRTPKADPHQPPTAAYPRPQLRRHHWSSLNGPWDFAIDEHGSLTHPDQVRWGRTILVPFAPETPASGVHDERLYNATWYRRTFEASKLPGGHRLILHFGAVDYEAAVWVNGHLAARHEGGYTPFSVDITDMLTKAGDVQTVVVRASDDPNDLAKPRGKQDWRAQPHSIWYMRTSGIWQTVWMEAVPPTSVASLRWVPDAERWEIGLEVRLAGVVGDGLSLRVNLRVGERLLADDTYAVTGDELCRRIAVTDPGIDDYRNELLWSPERPTLIEAELELRDAKGRIVDQVDSYTALRHVALLGNRFVLNNKPYYLRLALDQGYWPESGLTAPDDDALRRDVELLKQMGFNGVRKHQKIENPRFLYWADHLGLLVWEEMPSAYRFTKQTIQRLTSQWTEAIVRDVSHPCIVAWVPINESWGVPDLLDNPAQRHAVQALYHLTKTLDPTRPVIGNDGWEALATDILAVHDYDADPSRIACRYGQCNPEGVNHLLRYERPGHRVLMLEGFQYQDQPIMLTEFGGIAFSERAGTWGYSRAKTAGEFARLYYNLVSIVRSLPMFAGFCYTQFTDTYQEANGLLYMDRTPKFPLNQMAVATRGARGPDEQELERTWRGDVVLAPPNLPAH
jgi:beta-galactosidase/beta-glucuronidase